MAQGKLNEGTEGICPRAFLMLYSKEVGPVEDAEGTGHERYS